jgi:hypothetical protein
MMHKLVILLVTPLLVIQQGHLDLDKLIKGIAKQGIKEDIINLVGIIKKPPKEDSNLLIYQMLVHRVRLVISIAF